MLYFTENPVKICTFPPKNIRGGVKHVVEDCTEALKKCYMNCSINKASKHHQKCSQKGVFMAQTCIYPFYTSMDDWNRGQNGLQNTLETSTVWYSLIISPLKCPPNHTLNHCLNCLLWIPLLFVGMAVIHCHGYIFNFYAHWLWTSKRLSRYREISKGDSCTEFTTQRQFSELRPWDPPSPPKKGNSEAVWSIIINI